MPLLMDRSSKEISFLNALFPNTQQEAIHGRKKFQPLRFQYYDETYLLEKKLRIVDLSSRFLL